MALPPGPVAVAVTVFCPGVVNTCPPLILFFTVPSPKSRLTLVICPVVSVFTTISCGAKPVRLDKASSFTKLIVGAGGLFTVIDEPLATIEEPLLEKKRKVPPLKSQGIRITLQVTAEHC